MWRPAITGTSEAMSAKPDGGRNAHRPGGFAVPQAPIPARDARACAVHWLPVGNADGGLPDEASHAPQRVVAGSRSDRPPGAGGVGFRCCVSAAGGELVGPFLPPSG